MLVHCNAGVSRSSSVVIAYVLWCGAAASYEEAVLHVRQIRVCVNSSNFEPELLAWAGRLQREGLRFGGGAGPPAPEPAGF